MPQQGETSVRLPLEDVLRNDSDGVERDAVLLRLQNCATEIKVKMDAGAPPEEYARLDDVYRGLAAAARVVVLVWRRAHRV